MKLHFSKKKKNNLRFVTQDLSLIKGYKKNFFLASFYDLKRNPNFGRMVCSRLASNPKNDFSLTVEENISLSNEVFFNTCFDKNNLKSLIAWFLEKYGQKKTVDLVETLKQ